MARPSFTKPSATTGTPDTTAAAAPAAKPAPQGDTQPQQDGSSRARLPHERDESSDTQQASPDRIGEQAYEDAASQRADTSLAPVTDRVYRDLKKG